MVRHFWILLVVAVSLSVSPASGQSGQDKAAAEALFAEGRKLTAAGNHVAACEKFEASQKLDPAVGTMLNLADCYEKTGRTASAWATFRETATAARAGGSPDREELARSRAAALEQRLSTILVQAKTGIQISKDGRPLEPAMLGTPIPVDPGKHVIAATAPGKKPWSETVEIGNDRVRLELHVPELEAIPGAAPSTTQAVPSSAPGGTTSYAPTTPSPEQVRRSGKGQRIVAGGVGVVGLIGAGLGVYFTARASSLWSDARSHCSPYPGNCTDEAASLSRDAKEAGNLATIAGILGAAGLVGAAVLWFTAPRSDMPPSQRAAARVEPSVSIGVGPGSLVVRGAF
jgi:hypothetical protein